LAQTLWDLGYPDQAMQRIQEALTLAHAPGQPFSVAEALRYSVQLHKYLHKNIFISYPCIRTMSYAVGR